MRGSLPIVACALACALALPIDADARAKRATSDAKAALAPLPDPAKDWPVFLARGGMTAYDDYALVDAVEGEDIEVDAGPCQAHAAELDAALRRVPVGVALWYAAYRCAQLGDNAATTDHYLAGFTTLAKYALAQDSSDAMAPPIRVIGYPDIRALVQASGMEPRYAVLEPDSFRHLEFVQALGDADGKHERVLRFDFLDTLVALSRDEPDAAYPAFRHALARELVGKMAAAGLPEAIDLQATLDSVDKPDTAARVAVLRPRAEDGGLKSAWEWILLCAREKKSPHCADGLVEALLPQAEQRHGLALVLLAIAYAEGLGVPADEGKAMTLVDGAETQLGGGDAAVLYLRHRITLHPETLPDALRTRVERAAAGGNAAAARLLAMHRYQTPGFTASDADFAPLLALDRAGNPYVAWIIARMHLVAGRYAEAAPWVAKGAAAGDAAAQRMYAAFFAEGYGGVARDPAAARHWLELAAAGGNADAMRARARYAIADRDYAGAEQWLMSGMLRDDLDSALQLADLYTEGHPGLGGDATRAVVLLTELEDSMDRPELRRALAQRYAAGKGVPVDPKKARALLLEDAERGDEMSQLTLAGALAGGRLGKADPEQAEHWFAKAAAQGTARGMDGYAFWLFNRKDTAESRTKALDLWRRIDDADADYAANNLAWALCTTRHDDVRDPVAGLAAAGRMGEVAVLPIGYRDTVAACLAANGRFEEAAATQGQLIEVLSAQSPDDSSLPAMRERLALYLAGKPFIEAAPAP
jgi:TPR repeat protein